MSETRRRKRRYPKVRKPNRKKAARQDCVARWAGIFRKNCIVFPEVAVRVGKAGNK